MLVIFHGKPPRLEGSRHNEEQYEITKKVLWQVMVERKTVIITFIGEDKQGQGEGWGHLSALSQLGTGSLAMGTIKVTE